MRSETYLGDETRRVAVHLSLTTPEHTDLLRDITVTIHTGMATVSAYIDPDEARNLSDALREIANAVDGHDDDYRASLREGSR